MDKEKIILPLIPIRGITVFPNMVIHFDVARSKSIAAIEEAMMAKQEIFLVSQRDIDIEEPNQEDLYKIGTLCKIKQLLKLPEGTIRVLVEGITRGELVELLSKEEYYQADIQKIKDINELDKKEISAFKRKLKKAFRDYVRISKGNAAESILEMSDIEDLSELSDIIASYLMLKQEVNQELLELIDIKSRVEKLLLILADETEIIKIEKKIGAKVKRKIDKSQKEYFLREQIKAIQEELGEEDNEKKEIEELEKKIKRAKLPAKVKEKVNYEFNRLKSNASYSSEANIIKTYIDWILSLPWNKSTKENLELKEVRKVLDEEHYGLEDVKERIIEYLAIKKISKSLKGPILCLVGPPGVGKTSIARSIAKAINRNYVRISLGGVRDEAEIRGHRRTYVGAIPGRIAYAMREAKSNNPLMLFDEIDKMAADYKGDPKDALLEVFDSEQNKNFRDHYLETELDLSKVMFLVTANSLDTIPRPLLDRMEIIEVSGYTYEEKFNIAKNYLLTKVLKEHSVTSNQVKIGDNVLKAIIDGYTRESGVRDLERKISSLVRKAIADMLTKDKESINITTNNLVKYLGDKIFDYDKIDKEDKIGVVTGMAWTAYGGDTLPVEVLVMEGNGKLQLTGKLGEVMQESAKAAYSYVRANCEKYNIPSDFYKNKDIHIHVPEGAVPKDGPSAGVTLTTALTSALGKIPVKHNVAMTGEITLTGRVLPIGGLKEKSLAAYRAGVDTIIIPMANKKDIEDIPKSIASKLNIILADKIETVLKNALIGVETNEN